MQVSSIGDVDSVDTSPASSLAVSNIPIIESTKEKHPFEAEVGRNDDPDSYAPEERRANSLVKRLSALACSQVLFIILGFVACIMAGGSYTGEAVVFGHTLGHFDPCQGMTEIRSTGNLAGLLFFVIGLFSFCANVIGWSFFGKVSV